MTRPTARALEGTQDDPDAYGTVLVAIAVSLIVVISIYLVSGIYYWNSSSIDEANLVQPENAILKKTRTEQRARLEGAKIKLDEAMERTIKEYGQ